MVKVCTKCRKEKYVEEFNEYWHSTFQKHYRRGYCKACESEAKKKYKMGVKALILNKTDFWGGTTDDYYAMPNEYVDEDQRLSVFRVMKLMGWKFNHRRGIWYKEPFKLKDGTFPSITPQSERPNIRKMPQENIDKIRKMREDGIHPQKIADHIGCHLSTVWKYLNPNENYKKTKYKPKNGD
jgi:hypothetical protein